MPPNARVSLENVYSASRRERECLFSPLNVHTIALNIHTISLNIHTIALNIHTIALNVESEFSSAGRGRLAGAGGAVAGGVRPEP
eukprot:997534-Prorocentrum_minimum.AAC.2